MNVADRNHIAIVEGLPARGSCQRGRASLQSSSSTSYGEDTEIKRVREICLPLQ
jgi:hypothetical protein